MKILITGNMGYVGSVLTNHLKRCFPNSMLYGFDTGYFAQALTTNGALPERYLEKQYFGDIRKLPNDLFDNIDCVIHLAAISNDPMGNAYEAITKSINDHATVALAKTAVKSGVKRFVFASSCSMYGAASEAAKTEGDALNPLTAYARSKIAVEDALTSLDAPNMAITALRFATACGMSPRLRLDLVINDFVAGALTNGEITVLSDGTPWRPLITVGDMARAIEWALIRPVKRGDEMLAVNTGSNRWNYQVKDLAEAVADQIKGTKVSINKDAPADNRSYRVDFSLFEKLAPDHQPIAELKTTIQALKLGLEAINFNDKTFRQSSLMRLKNLERFRRENLLDKDLFWT